VPRCQNAPGGGPFDFFISEISTFQASPEVFICVSPEVNPAFTFNDVLVEPVPQGGLPDSDSVFVGQSTGSISNIDLNSDTEPNGIASLTGATPFPEVTMNCGPGGLPDPAGEPTNTCNGAVLPIQFLVNGSIINGSLTVISDVVVPEPSTGLLLGAVLPALLGIRRRLRVSG